MPLILSLDGKTPRIAPTAFIADNATIIGDVVIEDQASVWFGCVLRGDMGSIRIGARSNIQDLTCVHLTDGISNTIVGEDVTVGHGVILHGCTVGDRALIGMGSILLDNAQIGEEALVGGGSLVTQRTVIGPRKYAVGRPARVLRDVTDAEAEYGISGARTYVANAARYRAAARVL